ncbi:MAG: NAD-dependent epimerase/dehydratase family protein [Syntrophales bacterium]
MAGGFGRVLVTGGAGFLGCHLVEQLVADNHTVRVLEKPGVVTSHLPIDKIEIVFGDLRDERAVKEAAVGCDLVLHLAANPNLWTRDPHEFEEVNHQGTRRVLAAARDAGARRVVHVSTESILSPIGYTGIINEKTRVTLDDMIGPYCRSKWLAEQAVSEAVKVGDPVVIVRPSIPVGPGDRYRGPLSRMICDFCNGRLKAFLDGNLNLIDVRDVAAGIWAAAQRGEVGRCYLLVNENWRIPDLLRYLSGLVGRPTPRWRVPYPLALLFARLEEWFCTYVAAGRQPLATVTGVKLTRRSFCFDGTRSATDLGWQPARDCREAILEAVNWFRASGYIDLSNPAARLKSGA